MSFLLLQLATDGVRIDPSWVIITLLGTIGSLATAVTVLWRQSVAEGKRKDELIDRLVRQIGRTADVQDRTVSLVEKERTRR